MLSILTPYEISKAFKDPSREVWDEPKVRIGPHVFHFNGVYPVVMTHAGEHIILRHLTNKTTAPCEQCSKQIHVGLKDATNIEALLQLSSNNLQAMFHSVSQCEVKVEMDTRCPHCLHGVRRHLNLSIPVVSVIGVLPQG